MNWRAVLLTGFASVAASNAAMGQNIDAHARSQFMLYCSGCHQSDGSGHPNVGVPSMRNVLGQFVQSPAGRAFLVQVPGARNAPITDEELASLTNWELKTFSGDSLPANFAPYSVQEVALARAHPPPDIPATRADIVRHLAVKSSDAAGDRHK